jgi:ribose transport system permease protein
MRDLFTTYGMLLVLLVLCIYFSAVTVQEQYPEGAAAGRQLADTIVARFGTGARVVIVAARSKDDIAFADELDARLRDSDLAVAGVVKGQPKDVLPAVRRSLKIHQGIDVIACNRTTAAWGVVSRLPKQIPALRKTTVVQPESYSWPNFLKVDNLLNIANQIAVIAILAIGMTLVIITGGIDLSVGSLIALSAVVSTWLIWAAGGGTTFPLTVDVLSLVWTAILGGIGSVALVISARTRGGLAQGLAVLSLGAAAMLLVFALAQLALTPLVLVLQGCGPTPAVMVVCCLAAIALCAAVGALSGSLITIFRMPPFIVTLAMMLVGSGLALKIARGESIHQLPESFVWLGRGADLFHIPNAVALMGLLYLLAHVLMTRMAIGRYIYAVGGNIEAARLSGVPVRGVVLFVYTLSGALAGLGGIVLASQLRSGSPRYGEGYELMVIAAAVVGGTSLAGGAGRVLDTLTGALIIAVIANGMNLTGVSAFDQKVILGLVILGAVLFDTAKRRVS